MNLRDYLIKAFYDGAYKNAKWVISVLSITDPADDDHNYVPYQAIRTSAGIWGYYDPVEQAILDLDPTLDFNYPIVTPDTVLDINADEIINLKSSIKTTFGCMLANYYYFIDVCGDRFPYYNVEFNGKFLSKFYKNNVVDDDHPSAGYPGKMSTSEMQRSIDNGFALGGFSGLCVPTACPETMYPPRHVIELRDRLFEEHKNELHNPVVMGRIQEEILKEYTAYLMSTPAAKFFVSPKTINDAFNKMFITGGIETAFGTNVVVKNSLYEGWDLSVFPALANNSIEGSFNRGASTADGGKKVKDIIRVTQNILIAKEDCGTKVGIPWNLNKMDIERTIGSYALIDGKNVHLTADNIESYLGKDIIIRSPVICQSPHEDQCPYCSGSANSENEKGVSAGCSAVGSNIMKGSLKGMHKGSRITLVKYDLDLIFS